MKKTRFAIIIVLCLSFLLQQNECYAKDIIESKNNVELNRTKNTKSFDQIKLLGNYVDDNDYDDDYDYEQKEYTYTNVKKKYSLVLVSQSQGHTHGNTTLGDGKTNVYPVNIKKKTKYVIGITSGYGEGNILILNSKKKKVYEKKLDLRSESWKKTITLKKGKYYIKILSKTSIGFEYKLYVKSLIVKKDKNIKMTSCDRKKLNPNLGKGKWKTSNNKIVTIITAKSNKSTCTIRAKKAGHATITYTNKKGSVIKYKINVIMKKYYPFDRAWFEMDSVGGLKPHILISNNSNKKIKYVYLTVSFYNAVGDKVSNDIGGYKSANLQITGPIKPWNFSWYEWGPVFYNYTATKMKVEKVTIKYFGGSTKTVYVQKKYNLE